MSDDYKPAPEGARLELFLWRCGHEECDCHAFRVLAWLPPEHPGRPRWFSKNREWAQTLWEGEWFNPPRHDTLALRREVSAACEHYGLRADLTSDYVGEWETQEDE